MLLRGLSLLVALAAYCSAATPDACVAQRCVLENGTKCDRATEECPPCMKVSKSNITLCVDNSFWGKCIGTGADMCPKWVVPTTTQVPTTTTSKPNATTSHTPTTTIVTGTTAAPTTSPAPSSSSTSESGTNWGIYAGIGGGALVLLAGGVVFVMRRRRSEDDDDDDEPSVESNVPAASAKAVPLPPSETKAASPKPKTASSARPGNETLHRVLNNATQNELIDSDSESEEAAELARRQANKSVEF
ncbi:Aste57867_714 [Aphanomyces stellatus]|uniref:Aste57867_714 protein n=1 Tax=Aphanomyces stellatus TaxID=120398 RepID=A0A485K7F2_9STRA|nr:hypothetical protein As57867_000713 [Aphanomyces stellatus]VFT77938.1 Aste57867_714 [Aphanomyces stellatus]